MTAILRREARATVLRRLCGPQLPFAFRALASTLPPKPRRDLSKPFDPESIESGWHKYWESRSLFEPRRDDSAAAKRPVRMLLPPPNVTGELHIGHALMLSIEDALARYYRMNRYPVVWAPGTDHAGIATQSVVERMLERQRGVTRQELGREAFVNEVQTWRERCGRRILEQMKEMGASTTASREYYTLDEDLSTAVINAFVNLWEEGLVYRATRMVNWSVKLQTAVSDIEVVTGDVSKGTRIDGVEFGILHKFAFPLVEGDGEVIVSTTRPETIPGDRAIAVHPDDDRYQHLHYKLVRHPLIPSLTLPIVPDSELVDPEFGSGAVKITPAHDSNDYSFWKRHSSSSASCSSSKPIDIDLVSVFDSSGKMTAACRVDSLIGHDRLHIRKRVVKLLEEAGVYRGRDEHHVRVGICERSGAVIEPMLRPQWYLKMGPLAEKVMGVAERDGLKFVPEHPSKQLWEQWMDGIQDWCLSRQIWWGHRIPAYMVLEPSECEGRMLRWIAASNKEAAYAQLTQEEKAAGCFLKQDEDVLDTWFSSGLLPLSTAGWRGGNSLDHPDWKQNYPLSFIESGGDILFFWLARMAMLSTWFSDKLPYSEILLHPLVCDSAGRKMSKSVGNVLDPLLIIHGRSQADMISQLSADFSPQLSRGGEAAKNAEKEIRKRSAEIRKSFPKGIATSGADSLRMALLDYTRQQRQINLELRQIDAFRKLAIKLDNAFKFFYNTRSSSPFTFFPLKEIGREELRPHDLFLLHHSRNLVGNVHVAFETRQLHTAAEGLRVYTYDVLCSAYLEFIKKEVVYHPGKKRRDVVLSVLQHVLDVLLRLYHPFMPFLSESLWQELSPETRAEKDDGESIVTAAFPQVEELPEVKPKEFTVIRPTLQLISTLRAYREVCRDGDESLAVGVESGKRWGVYVEAMWETVRMMGRMRTVEMSAEMGVVERLGGGGWDMVFEGEGGWKVWKRGEEGIVVRAWNGENDGDQEEAGEGRGD